MGHKNGLTRLERQVLQAASLGSVKLVRTLLQSLTSSSRKEQRKYLKRRRQDDRKSFDRESFDRESLRGNKRARKADPREHRGIRKKKRDRYSKEVESFSSDGESEELDVPSEEMIEAKRARREKIEEIRNKHPELATSDDEEPENDQSLSSDSGRSGKESNDESTTESEIENINSRPLRRKHITPEALVKSIVNCRDSEGLSPLHHACHAGAEDLALYLILNGASVHVRDSQGDTPLHIAAKLGPASLVNVLSKAGADMEACNDKGTTPSDILDEKAAAARRAKVFSNKEWFSHVAGELSDNDDNWWGAEWGEESERPDFEDPFLERMAEKWQGKGVYSEPFSLRDYLKMEKNKAASEQDKKSKGKGRHADRPSRDDKRKIPKVVIGPTVKVSVPTDTYKQRWKIFAESYNLCLSYSSVPFPIEEGKEDTLRDVLLQGIKPSMHRITLRAEMLKWHPDKFLQKWGAKLQGPDHERIVNRVNVISEAIHKLYKAMTAAT